MIVTVTIPNSNRSANYGRCNILADENRQMEVPDYVALTLCTLPGVTSAPTVSGTVAALLAAADQDFEANFIFSAFGQQPPASGRISAAGSLLTANGVPSVSLG